MNFDNVEVFQVSCVAVLLPCSQGRIRHGICSVWNIACQSAKSFAHWPERAATEVSVFRTGLRTVPPTDRMDVLPLSTSDTRTFL